MSVILRICNTHATGTWVSSLRLWASGKSPGKDALPGPSLGPCPAKLLLWMEEILHQLNPVDRWDVIYRVEIPSVWWCRICSIHSRIYISIYLHTFAVSLFDDWRCPKHLSVHVGTVSAAGPLVFSQGPAIIGNQRNFRVHSGKCGNGISPIDRWVSDEHLYL
jgi:hypothetical protein